MLVSGLLCFLFAAIALLFAFKPREAFYLTEGWKFKDRLEPSDAYVASKAIGGIFGAIVMVGVGIWMISRHLDDKRVADEKAASATSWEKCTKEVLPRYQQTVKWDGYLVANSDEVKALGKELGVDIEIKRSTGFDIGKQESVPADDVTVSDPKKPGSSKSIFLDLGLYHGSTLFCY